MTLSLPISLDWRTVPDLPLRIPIHGSAAALVGLPSAADLAAAAERMRLRRDAMSSVLRAEHSDQADSARLRCEKKWAAGSQTSASPEKASESVKQRIESKVEREPRRKAPHSVELKEVSASSRRLGRRARWLEGLKAKPADPGEADPGTPPGKPKDLRLFLPCAAIRRARSRRLRTWVW